MTSTRCWWSPGKQRRRSSVRPAVTQRGTRDWSKNSRLAMGLKFRSDKNISKWPPRGGCAPHPGRKMSPLCSTSGGSETLLRIRSLAGSIIDTLESSLQNGRLHGPLCRALLAIADPKPISSAKGHIPQRAHKLAIRISGPHLRQTTNIKKKSGAIGG